MRGRTRPDEAERVQYKVVRVQYEAESVQHKSERVQCKVEHVQTRPNVYSTRAYLVKSVHCTVERVQYYGGQTCAVRC